MSNTRDPYEVPLLMLEVLPQNREKAWHYKKNWIAWYVPKIEVCICGCSHFRINESSVRAVLQEEKETHEAVAAASPARMETLYFLEKYLFIWYWKCSFSVGAGFAMISIPIDSYNLRKSKVMLWKLKAKGKWRI